MPRRPLRPTRVILVVAGLLVVAGFAVLRQAPPSSPTVVADAASPATPGATAAEPGARHEAPQAKGIRARYQLTTEIYARLDGRVVGSLEVDGVWTTTRRRGGRVEAQLSASKIDGLGDDTPSAADATDPCVLALEHERLARIGFSSRTPESGRHLLTSVATLLQLTQRTDATWSVAEDDQTGSYEALYRRDGDRITRTRGRYTHLLHGAGLGPEALDRIVSDENSEFIVDSRGIVSAKVRLDQTASLSANSPEIKTDVTVTLTRIDATEVPLEDGIDLLPQPITSHANKARLGRKSSEALVAGASLETLLADAVAAAHVVSTTQEGRHAHSRALVRLAAQAELDSRSPALIAAALRAQVNDLPAFGLIAGALSSADSPDATRALASTLPGLDGAARDQVIVHLGLAKAPTAESAAALTQAMQNPDGAAAAALALGAEAQKLGDTGPGGDAIDTLLKAYGEATTPEGRRVLLRALANTGSRRILPVMKEAIAGGDYALAQAGAFGLRWIPGEDVDDLLNSLIASGSSVILSSIKATGYRSPALWTPRLEAFRSQFQEQKIVLDALQAVISHLRTVAANN